MEPESGVVIAGKYQLDAPIARGGMGMVWSARHIKLGSRIAVKFVDPHFAKTPTFLARFEREARAAALIDSPHVVHVQDFGIEDGTPYLVMELLTGEDLGARLRRVRRIPFADTARILAQAGHALRRAHEAGIIHRDLKPANLFLAQVYEQEVVKVLDFGIAKETASPVGETTTTGEVIGSPHYMGPEQARADKDIDHRSDLWSVGVLLYRMLTGVLPFPGDVMGAILAKVFVDPPPPVASVAPDLPPALDDFFAKALAKRKEDRFQTIDELVAAFWAIAEVFADLPPELRGSITSSGRVVRAPLASVPLIPGAPIGEASLPPKEESEPSAEPPQPSAPASVTPPPGSIPSMGTGAPIVQDAELSFREAPKRRHWIVLLAALLLIALGAISLWIASSKAPPIAASADSPVPGPATVTPSPTASTESTPTVKADPSAAVAPTPSATQLNTATGGSPAKTKAPASSSSPSSSKGPKKGDEWGF